MHRFFYTRFIGENVTFRTSTRSPVCWPDVLLLTLVYQKSYVSSAFCRTFKDTPKILKINLSFEVLNAV